MRIFKKEIKSYKSKKINEKSGEMLAVIQIVITVVGFLSSAFAAETLADYFVVKISPYVTISESLLEDSMIVVITLILSYFTLVLGELVPKKVALSSLKKIAYATLGTLAVLLDIFYPVIRLLSLSTNLVSRREEIIDLEEELLLRVFKFDDTIAKDVMTIRENMVAVDLYTSQKVLFNLIRNNRYTRIPVYKDKMDNVIGIFNVKEFLVKYSTDNKVDFRKILKEPLFIDANEKNR